MAKEPEEEEFTFDDYEDSEDEGLDLPDLEAELEGLQAGEETKGDETKTSKRPKKETSSDEIEDEDEDESDEDDDEINEDEINEDETSEDEDADDQDSPQQIESAPPPEKISREDVSLPVTIEIGRLNIALDKLFALQEGNTLELSVSPENGVDLMVHGKCIGKGELLKVGDKIGVRILELA